MNVNKVFLLLSTLSFFILNSAFSQSGTWTWISGGNTVNSPGVFGTQGVPSVNNHPPGLYEAAEWKDRQGNFWLYGGSDNLGGCSDLWKYNPLTNEWTWVKGNGGVYMPPVFGTKGVPASANTPGDRIYGIASWVDSSGTLWLLGGSGRSNDLWSYSVSTNEWTWVSGDSAINAKGVYGTQGVPSPLNNPGARLETASAWTDSLNNLWLFGGWGFDKNGTLGTLNDLWKYDPVANEWTWIKGSNTISATPDYGTKGVFAASNDPGGRWTYTKWKDIYGNFWIMGGCPINSCLNDVWKYDLSINEWSWMSGPSAQDDPGSYAANCVFDTSNAPQCRLEQRSSATDNCSRFWLFGGINNSKNIYDLNDLWIFDPQQLKWNWVSGSNLGNQAGNYGTLGVSSPLNMPPSRDGGVAWWGKDNRFYIFGGQVINFYSDLWVYTPDTNCVPSSCNSVAALKPVAFFQSSDTIICASDCINFTDLSTNNPVSWQWLFAGAIDSTSTAQNPQNVCYEAAGSYNVTLIASNAGGKDTLTLSNYIVISPAPPTPVITQTGTTLYCSTNSSYISYQWYSDSTIINSATDTSLIITHGGNYNVQVTNASGCSVAVGINVVLGIQNYSSENLISLSPNPATDELSITSNWSAEAQNYTSLHIFNLLGQPFDFSQGASQVTASHSRSLIINISALPAGIYFVRIISESGSWVSKFVKE